MRHTLIVAASVSSAVVGASQVRAQWVTFADETSTRLTLTQVSMNDNQEKDMWAADFDRDGWTDVIVVRKQPFSNPGARVDVLLMNENGVLTDRTAEFAPDFITTLTDARDVVVADLDNDGWKEIVVVNTFGGQPQYYENLGADAQGAWLGFQNQTANHFPTLTVNPLKMCAGWAGDVTGDGFADIYLTNYQPGGGGAQDVLLVNQGNGFFADESDARLGNLRNSAFGTGVEIRDIDNDGDMDIVKTSTLYGVAPWNQVGIFPIFNDGTGHFNWTGMQLGGGNPYMFTVVDLNNDGKLDVYAEKDSQDVVYMAGAITPDVNIAYASHTINPSPRTSGFGGNTKAADIDGDGDLDVGVGPIDVDIANCGGGGVFALLENPGDGFVFDPYSSAQNIHIQPHDFHFFDIDNDGCMDIFMGLCTGWRVFIQNSEGCGVTGPTGDLNGDGVVDGADLASLLAQWGTNGSADLNGDGTVNGADLAELLANWGPV